MNVESKVPNKVHLEWIILADYAEVVAGKLYVMGGGWTAILGETLPVARNVSIAVSCQVPWNLTNELHRLEFVAQDQDGNLLDGFNAMVEFEVGRPPGMPRGQEQRLQVAVSSQISFEAAGSYSIIVRLNDEDLGHANFGVLLRR